MASKEIGSVTSTWVTGEWRVRYCSRREGSLYRQGGRREGEQRSESEKEECRNEGELGRREGYKKGVGI